MIRLVQRRLIIPRGDTGTFSVPVLSSYNSGDAAVFSIIDPRTQSRVYNKLMYVTDNVISVRFEHGDTVNLPVGKFLWDIKFYEDPIIDEGQVVSGKEVDSYYAAFTMPACEIRQTGDNLLTADDAPGSTLTPQHINAINAALFALNEAVEKTETNVTHYPTIISGEWNVWDANLGDYTTTGIEATGNGIASIEKTNTEGLVDTYTVNFTDGTTFLYNITNGSSISSITKQSTSGLEDTYVIIYTDGNSTTFTVTNGATPNISIGIVQEGPIAAASITGSAANPVLNLTLPNANVPTRVSELENDAGYLTEHQDLSDYVQKTDYATNSEAGVVKVGNGLAMSNNGTIGIQPAPSVYIKAGDQMYNPISPKRQHEATFYGLAKAAGDITQSQSANAVGTYTNEAKAAIQTMLDVPSNADVAAKQDTLTFDNAPTANSTNPVTSGGVYSAIANVNTMKIHICAQGEYNSETGVPTIQNPDTQTFYLVPGGEGSNLFIEWVYVNNSWERFGSADVEVPVQDVQVNGASIVSNGIANIQKASSSNLGVVGIEPQSGVDITSSGKLEINPASTADIKRGENTNKPIVPFKQDVAAFYGLATAAGDATQSVSNNPVGTYTDEAKTAIQTMLNVPSTDDIPEVPVQDVQVAGTSVLNNGVADIPQSSLDIKGVVKGQTAYGTQTFAGVMAVIGADANEIQEGVQQHKPITPKFQSNATFYGLAKAAGADMKDIANTTVGTYPDAQKEAIQSMLGISQMLAPTNPNLVATQAYAIGDVFAANGKLYKATAAIAQDAAIIPDTNCVETTMVDESVRDVQVDGVSIINNSVANIPIADRDTVGVVKIGNGLTIDASTKKMSVVAAAADAIKNGSSTVHFLNPNRQHISIFYGLSKLAGVDLASETVTLGTYPETSKVAIRTMLGATSNNVIAVQDTQPTDPDTKIWLPETAGTAVQVPTVAEMNAALSGKVSDVQVDGTSVVTNGVANVPLATTSAYGVARVALDSEVKSGTSAWRVNTPSRQDASTFYGLAKAAGADMAQSSNAVGQYTDAAKTAIKAMIGVEEGLKVVRLI